VYDCIGRLGEEEGRFAVGIKTHLARMLGIIAAHAKDPANRELLCRSGYGNGNVRVWLEGVFCHHFLENC
jgi:hypothetical protein